MTLAEYRRTRRQLYEHLAALHTGPLGTELVPQIKRLAAALELGEGSDVLTKIPADLYRWTYGYCPGSPQLGCQAAAPSGCLWHKFMHLADSAGKGAAQRRQREAAFITGNLVPCLQTFSRHLAGNPYQALIDFSTELVLADAKQLESVEADAAAKRTAQLESRAVRNRNQDSA